MGKASEQNGELPYVLFFMGHFNDIDHMLPVAYKLWHSRRGRPIILLTEPFYDVSGDYRLRFAMEQCGIPVKVVFDFEPMNHIVGLLARLLGSLNFGAGFFRNRRDFTIRVFSRLFYRKAWASRMLDKYRPAALVFEWAHPSGIFGSLIRTGHEKGIRSLTLPHGMLIYTNDFVTQEQKELGYADRSYRNTFDCSVYQSSLHARLAQIEGVRADKIAVLGSTRYCEEWQKLNLKLQPDRFSPQKGEGCTFRVVFMFHQWSYNTDFEATFRTLRRLAAEEWLHLVLKPHTREVEERPPYLMELDRFPNVEIEGKTGSVELIRWADAVIVAGSSIALEAILQAKPILYPKYHHENTTVFEETGASWQVSSDDELISALKQLAEGGSPPYGDEEISRVKSILVLGGSGDQDVLRRYVDVALSGRWDGPEVEQGSSHRGLVDADPSEAK